MPPRLARGNASRARVRVLIAVAIGGAVGTVFGLITARLELARAILDPATMTAGTVPILEGRLACHRNASLPVPLGKEHPPTEYGARPPARLVDRPLRLPSRRRPCRPFVFEHAGRPAAKPRPPGLRTHEAAEAIALLVARNYAAQRVFRAAGGRAASGILAGSRSTSRCKPGDGAVRCSFSPCAAQIGTPLDHSRLAKAFTCR